MSLIETDLQSPDRSAPVIHEPDLQAQRMAHGTTAFTLVSEQTPVDAAKLVVKDGRLRVYKNDGTFLGSIGIRASDSDGAIDIAKPGQTL